MQLIKSDGQIIFAFEVNDIFRNGFHAWGPDPADRNPFLALYRGVLVVLDEDVDIRVLAWIDSQPCVIVDQLFMVQEHEGSLSLLWKGKSIPEDYTEESGTTAEDGDYWTIFVSRVIG